MQRYSDEDLADAVRVQWLADAAAGNHWPERDQAGPLTVPPQFTAWLLMSRAHMPLELIAEVCGVEPRTRQPSALYTGARPKGHDKGHLRTPRQDTNRL
jgi:hypothetical protein